MKLSQEILEELKTTDSISRKNEIVKSIEDRTQQIINAIAAAFHLKKDYMFNFFITKAYAQAGQNIGIPLPGTACNGTGPYALQHYIGCVYEACVKVSYPVYMG